MEVTIMSVLPATGGLALPVLGGAALISGAAAMIRKARNMD